MAGFSDETDTGLITNGGWLVALAGLSQNDVTAGIHAMSITETPLEHNGCLQCAVTVGGGGLPGVQTHEFCSARPGVGVGNARDAPLPVNRAIRHREQVLGSLLQPFLRATPGNTGADRCDLSRVTLKECTADNRPYLVLLCP